MQPKTMLHSIGKNWQVEAMFSLGGAYRDVASVAQNKEMTWYWYGCKTRTPSCKIIIGGNEKPKPSEVKENLSVIESVEDWRQTLNAACLKGRII